MSKNFTGFESLLIDGQLIDTFHQYGKIYIESLNIDYSLYPNTYIEFKSLYNPKHTAIGKVSYNGQDIDKIKESKVYGLQPRNREQIFALDALLDDNVPVVILTGRAGSGKAQPLDSKVLTPNGWVKMGELKVGDNILTPSNEKAKILDIYPQGIKDIYKVIFQDGSSTECCLEHLWYTKTQRNRDSKQEGSIKNLEEIKKTLRYGKIKKRNHSIPMVNSLDFEEKELILDPYLLGVLLGDGGFSIGSIDLTNGDIEIINKIEKILTKYDMRLNKIDKYSYRIIHNIKPTWTEGNFIKNSLKKLNLWGHLSYTKFIPKEYLYNTFNNRLKLLHGLMDTDGTISKNGYDPNFSTSSLQLAKNVQELVLSMGGKATITEKKNPFYTYLGEKKQGHKAYRVWINLPFKINPFSLSRKANLYKPTTKYKPTRYIDRIEYVGKKEAQCIYIDHKDHLYITDDYIVTHNSILSTSVAIDKRLRKKYKKVVLSKPMSQVGEFEIGTLPGGYEEKIEPYLSNFKHNIEYLYQKTTYQDIIADLNIEVIPMQFFRGASFIESLVIVDECQVLRCKDILTIGTRIGENSKLILMGDLNQRDTNIKREDTGLYQLINNEMAKKSPLITILELQQCERSATAKLFSDIFPNL